MISPWQESALAILQHCEVPSLWVGNPDLVPSSSPSRGASYHIKALSVGAGASLKLVHPAQRLVVDLGDAAMHHAHL